MDNLERSALAEVVVEITNNEDHFEETLRTVERIDRLCWVSESPIVIENLLPGVGLLVMRPKGVRAPDEHADLPETSKLLDEIARDILGRYFIEHACVTGAMCFESKDGLCYFVFLSENQPEVLAAALVNVGAPRYIRVGQDLHTVH